MPRRTQENDRRRPHGSTLATLTMLSTICYMATGDNTTPAETDVTTIFEARSQPTVDVSETTPPAPNETNNSSRRRSSRRRRPEVAATSKKKSRTRQRSQLQKDRLALGRANALRDRILQHNNPDRTLPHNLKQMFRTVKKKITVLKRRITKKATAADVSVVFCLLFVVFC